LIQVIEKYPAAAAFLGQGSPTQSIRDFVFSVMVGATLADFLRW